VETYQIKKTKPVKTIIESKIERTVATYAKSKGFIAQKFSPMNSRGLPDHLFITPYGQCIFVEFKRLGAKPTERQTLVINKLINQGCLVFVIDNIEAGKKLIDIYFERNK
jgi:hypothetical protein